MSWIQEHLSSVYPIKQHIPSILHIIWVGKSEQPETLKSYIVKWKELMPHWTIRVWGNDDLNDKEFHPDMLVKILSANRSVQKADIMRYSIIEKYGGVYVDADVEPARNLDPILYMSDLVLCHDNYITWEYIQNAVFAASPNHPVLKKAIQLCMGAELNTDNPHMTTGPHVLARAVASTPPISEKYTLLPLEVFHWPEGGMHPTRLASHHSIGMWNT